jgi:hypothetical protein
VKQTKGGIILAIRQGMRLIALLLAAATLVPATVRAADDDQTPATAKIVVSAQPAARPLMLPPLYVSLAGLQLYDGYATLRGVTGGGREANVLVGGLASKPAAFWAVKAGSTALTIVLAEQLWRTHHRGEAIATMVVANGLMAYVAARNASILRASR